MTDDIPRNEDGTFGKGAGWTSDQAREAARRSHAPGTRKTSSDRVEQEVNELLQERGVDPATAPTTLKILARNAIKGTSADMRLLLQQFGELQGTNDKYDGKGPCPTCGQTPGEGLVLSLAQRESQAKALAQLEQLVSESEALVQREREIDKHPIPYSA